MDDSINDEHIQANIENVLRAFAIYPEQKRYWSGFALHCMEIGVAFMHVFQTELKTTPDGRKADFLKEKCNISKITFKDIKDMSNGNSIPANVRDLIEHFKKSAAKQNARIRIQKLLKRILTLERQKTNILDQLETNMKKFETFEKNILDHNNMWQTLKESLSEKEKSLIRTNEEMKNQLTQIQNSSDANMKDTVTKTLTTLEKITLFLNGTIDVGAKSAEIDVLKQEISDLKSEIERSKSDVKNIELSDNSKGFLDQLEKQIDSVSTHDSNDDDVVPFPDFDLSLTNIVEEIQIIPHLQNKLAKFLIFLRSCCIYFHISNTIAKKVKSKCYDNDFIKKCLSWIHGKTVFETFFMQLMGVNKKKELTDFCQSWIKLKKDFFLDPAYSIALQFASVKKDSEIILKIQNSFPSKKTQMSCIMYDNEFIKLHKLLLESFIFHLISLLTHLKLDLKHVNILLDIFGNLFSINTTAEPMPDIFPIFLTHDFFDVLPLHLFHQGFYLLNTETLIYKKTRLSKIENRNFFKTFLSQINNISLQTDISMEEKKTLIKTATDLMISQIS